MDGMSIQIYGGDIRAMNKQQTLSNGSQTASPKACGTDLRGEDPIKLRESVIRLCELDSELERLIAEELLGDGPVHFKNANDVKKYMTKTGQIPVVQKIKAKPRSDRKHHPADDYFELVESFSTYEEAQQFIEGKLSLLIWSVPMTTTLKTQPRKKGAT